MQKININNQTLWQLIIFVLGLFFILTLREHLQDKIKVEAETARAKCIADMAKTFPGEERFAVCTDIKTYKLRVDYQK